jgi:hypothetical protein
MPHAIIELSGFIVILISTEDCYYPYTFWCKIPTIIPVKETDQLTIPVLFQIWKLRLLEESFLPGSHCYLVFEQKLEPKHSFSKNSGLLCSSSSLQSTLIKNRNDWHTNPLIKSFLKHWDLQKGGYINLYTCSIFRYLPKESLNLTEYSEKGNNG